MMNITARSASADDVANRVETFRSKYAGNPLIDRIEHKIDSDWSGEPSLFLKVILSPGQHDFGMLNNLASDLRLDELHIIHSEDLGLHSYLNFESQS